MKSADERRREKERQAATGGPEDIQRSLHEAARATGEGRMATFRNYIGKRVYIEGARMNWRGVMVGFYLMPSGDVGELALHPCARIGEWDENGVQKAYEEVFPTSENNPALIPWVGGVTFMALEPLHWPANDKKAR